ncbi:N-acetyltransferase family protein [Maribacter sp. 2307ULW6-5]|uniref:GNAT family N-acetyltransferase n=1 Tax=Maribacter sp. 2307ULW6-5 TaxID=3386275 RepID=UPI0039BC526E
MKKDMDKDITLREATEEDLPVLWELEQGVIAAERPFDPTIRPDPVHYYDLPALMASPLATVVVACAGTQIVASGFAQEKRARPYLDHTTYAYLGFMYTVPQWRGKGINGLVLEHIKAWAAQRGLTELRLTVYEGNEAAIRAYAKAGLKKHIAEMRLSLV